MPVNEPTAMYRMLHAESIAVIGASEDRNKFGGRLIYNLIHHGFKGTLYPINPKRETIFDLKAYPNITALPSGPDVAAVAVPAKALSETLRGCAKMGVKVAIVITSQMAESGEEGAKLQDEAVAIAREAGMRILGPNCLGALNAQADVCLSPSVTMSVDKLPKGRVGVASQSGALQTAMFIRAFDAGVGFSSCITVGNQADLELSDGFEYLVDDPDTDAIFVYVEGIKDLERFRTAAQKARAANKPVVAVKAGRTEEGAAMANSHTASLTGSYDAFVALCESLGIVVTDQPDTAVVCADALARWGAPKAEGVAVFSGSGGAAALAADAIAESSFHASKLSGPAIDHLGEHLPHRKETAIIDFGGYRSPFVEDVMIESMETVADDPDTGALLMIMTPQPCMEQLAAAIRSIGTDKGVPALLCNKSGSLVDEQVNKDAKELGYPIYTSLDDCYRVIEALMAYKRILESAEGDIATEPATPEINAAARVLAPGLLTEPEAKGLLAAAGAPVTREQMAMSPDDAVAAAREIGFPVVMKGVARGLIHKSDAGAVKLNLADVAAVRSAFAEIEVAIAEAAPDAELAGCLVQEMATGGVAEAFIGASWDPQHGPAVLVGAGGVFVEVLKDVQMAAAPVSPKKARAMIEGLKLWPLFAGPRGRPKADVDALADIVHRVSVLAAHLGPQLGELDVNPVIVRAEGEGALCVDARAVWNAPQ
ncbi:MAG: acetate--CoA ligase family protein [Rhodospirillaceae bacterium]|nr:acetate--CoA ligase family protein [Rhodospirillaceae bacterium]